MEFDAVRITVEQVENTRIMKARITLLDDDERRDGESNVDFEPGEVPTE